MGIDTHTPISKVVLISVNGRRRTPYLLLIYSDVSHGWIQERIQEVCSHPPFSWVEHIWTQITHSMSNLSSQLVGVDSYQSSEHAGSSLSSLAGWCGLVPEPLLSHSSGAQEMSTATICPSHLIPCAKFRGRGKRREDAQEQHSTPGLQSPEKAVPPARACTNQQTHCACRAQLTGAWLHHRTSPDPSLMSADLSWFTPSDNFPPHTSFKARLCGLEKFQGPVR